MTSRSDGVAQWRRKARFRHHRELSDVQGWRPFVRDTVMWSAVMAAVLGILVMWGSVPDYGPTSFSSYMGEGEAPNPVFWPTVLGTVILGFGLFIAWCSQRCRDAARRRGSEGDGG